MNQKLSLYISFSALFFSVFLFYKSQVIEKKLNGIDELILKFDNKTEKALFQIDSSYDANNLYAQDDFKNSINNISNEILEEKIYKYRSQLNSIQDKVKREKDNLKKIQNKKNRTLLNLPEQVDLDKLYKYYRGNSSVNFDTEKGSIHFNSYDIDIKLIPSLLKPAWIRIGKSESSENSAIIKAWLYEASKEKRRQGYKLISNRTRPSDYGEYTEKLYKKGDMYFKTYYQYIRYQGTYNSHYLRYKFYIEIGSNRRKARYFTEQYNSKVGS